MLGLDEIHPVFRVQHAVATGDSNRFLKRQKIFIEDEEEKREMIGNRRNKVISIRNKVTGKLQREYFAIESRNDISDDKKVSQIIKITASICAGIVTQPIPIADFFILTPIQAFMGSRIARIRGVHVTKNSMKNTLKELSGVVGLGLGAQQFTIGAYKVGLPLLGGFMAIPLAYGLTYGIGRVLDTYFIAKDKKQLFDPEKLKEAWKKGKKEGKDKHLSKQDAEELSFSGPTINFVRTNLDELAILASFESIRTGFGVTEYDQAVLEAFKRYSDKTQDMESVRDYLEGMTEEQILGVISNVKGILHEIEFVRMENSDGDSVTATLFPETNHKGFDIELTDESTGQVWQTQLKTTDNEDYVQEWIEKHPDGEILVSKEIADEMGLPSSGFSNEEITVKVETFTEKLLDASEFSPVWYLLPTSLALISISLVVRELYKRYRDGEITIHQFKSMCLKITGIKTGKFAVLMVALKIPVVNVFVGTVLIAKIIYSLSLCVDKIPKKLGKTGDLTAFLTLKRRNSRRWLSGLRFSFSSHKS